MRLGNGILGVERSGLGKMRFEVWDSTVLMVVGPDDEVEK